MSAKLPTKEEELCHLENRLKNKKWLYIGCIQEMFYEDGIGDFNGIGEFIFITIFYDIIFGILYYFGAISFSILFIFIVIKIIIYLNTHIPQVTVKLRNDSFNFLGIYV